MINLTDHLFTDEVLRLICNDYGTVPEELVKHEGFCSYVYEGSFAGKTSILKISHSSRVSRGAIESELVFASFMAERGVNVCAPIGRPEVRSFSDGCAGMFYSYLYAKVDGEPICEKATKTEDDFCEVGRLIGALHRASTSFDFQKHSYRHSFLNRDFVNYRLIIPADELDTHRCFDGIFKELSTLPRSSKNYGMTHGDAHDCNIMANNGQVTLIDFDDIEPGFFVNDLAVFIDHCSEGLGDGKPDKEWIEFVASKLFKGYRQVFEIDRMILAQAGLFMKFRWVMNHCLARLRHGDKVTTDQQLLIYHRRKLEMFSTDFEYYHDLFKFDFVSVYDKC